MKLVHTILVSHLSTFRVRNAYTLLGSVGMLNPAVKVILELLKAIRILTGLSYRSLNQVSMGNRWLFQGILDLIVVRLAVLIRNRGKMLGGSSGLNFLAWNRASRPEYDAWTQFANGVDWSFNGFLPYFKKSTTTHENQTNPYPGILTNETTADFDPHFVGFDGPIQVSHLYGSKDPR